MAKDLLILNQLIVNQEFRGKVVPFLKEDYFQNQYHKLLFSTIYEYLTKYGDVPSKEALIILLKPKTINFTDDNFKALCDIIESDLYNQNEIHSLQWLLDTTEEFCQSEALFLGIQKSIEIYKGLDKELKRDAIPDILKDALAVNFDTEIGIDYFSDLDVERRFNYYLNPETGVPVNLEKITTITNGIGIPKKALSIILASTGCGKTLVKNHMAADAIRNNNNVLYLTMEMTAERIAQRIDANLLDLDLNSIPTLPFDSYKEQIGKLRETIKGKLFIKEFPTASANSLHFRQIIDELYQKKGVRLDLVIVDYLNICLSSRYKTHSGVNSYTLLKAVAEELRSLAMEYNCAFLTSSQINRSGYDNKDAGLESISDSMGIVHTGDLVISLFRDENLDNLDRILITQLKNRFGDISKLKRFLLGIERNKMKLFDVSGYESMDFVGQSTKLSPSPDATDVPPTHFKGRGTKSSFDGFQF